MADDYSVEIEGHAFAAAPQVHWTARAVFREDVYPAVLAALDYEVALEGCHVFATTPAAAVDALGAWLQAVLHKRTLPTYCKVKDASGTVVDEIGDMNLATAGWEDLRIEAFSLPPSVEQLRAGATFSLALRVRRVFHDSATGVVELERRYDSEFGPDGLETRRLTSRGRLSRESQATPLTAAVTALLRLTKPAGWVITRGNNSRRFDLTYPNHNRTDIFEAVSEVSQRGPGIVVPDGAGDAGGGTTRSDDPELGLVRVSTFVDAIGATSGDSFLTNATPAGAVGEKTHDRGRRSTRGSWDTWEPAGALLGGRVSRVSVSYSLRPGGQTAHVSRLTGNLKPIVREGAVKEWRIVEVVRAIALGARALTDVPTAPRLALPKFFFDPEASIEEPPRIVRRGGNAAQHVWERLHTREYVWDGDTDPLDDEEVKRLVMRRYEVGEEGLVLA